MLDRNMGKILKIKALVLSVLRAVLVLAALLIAPPLWAGDAPAAATVSPDYLIGPGDTLQIFVWRNPDLSVTVPVRPDGKISTPLVEDMPAVGKTPSVLARDIETA